MGDPESGSLAYFVRPEAAAWVAAAVAVGLGFLTPNPLLTAAALVTLPALVVLLWRRGEVPILLLAVAYQWAQVTAKVFHADMLGVRITEIGATPTVETATWLSLGALVVLALGMRLALRGMPPPRGGEAAAETERIPIGRAFWLYVVCAVIALVAKGSTSFAGALTQPADALDEIRWVGFFVLGYVVLKQRRGHLLFAAVALFEFVQGIGFFAGFKSVVFMTILVAFTVHGRVGGRTIGIASIGLFGLLVLGSVWTAVKMEYRGFLNQGSGMQETVVSRDEQFDELGDLVGQLSPSDVQDAVNPLLARLAYVDMFALTMDYVPAVVPHQEGGVWADALRNTVVPRALFPNKPILASDSEHSMLYTGVVLASDGEGTSISLGYVADSYIDFGPVWMYAIVFAIGLLWGGMYRYFLTRSSSALLAFAFAAAALLAAYQFEIASVKLVAGVVMKFLVLAVVLRLFGETIRSWLGLDETEAHGAWSDVSEQDRAYA